MSIDTRSKAAEQKLIENFGIVVFYGRLFQNNVDGEFLVFLLSTQYCFRLRWSWLESTGDKAPRSWNDDIG